ncbi:unnamed protein product [Polarella glacialis]|uniref:Uncharacterized protein n=1 Tax=Polarella glacialis TaxID=89957 RepID=A0A813IC55_POLGL|nr:unnamed protein product [Polarella glacialis]CAE8647847.1 unnamed protein product [Polarella glacialis]
MDADIITVRNVERIVVDEFVNNYLSGSLTPAGSKINDDVLSYHFPKTHCKGSRKKFYKTSNGCLVYYSITKSLIFHNGMKDYWDKFCQDPTPKWKLAQENPAAYDDEELASGKWKQHKFVLCFLSARAM